MGGLWATPLCTPGCLWKSKSWEFEKGRGSQFFRTSCDLGSGKTHLNVPKSSRLSTRSFCSSWSVVLEVWWRWQKASRRGLFRFNEEGNVAMHQPLHDNWSWGETTSFIWWQKASITVCIDVKLRLVFKHKITTSNYKILILLKMFYVSFALRLVISSDWPRSVAESPFAPLGIVVRFWFSWVLLQLGCSKHSFGLWFRQRWIRLHCDSLLLMRYTKLQL